MSEFDDNRPQNENGDPSPQEEPRPAPEHSGVDAGAAPPPRDGKKPKLSRPALIALAVLAVFLLVGALGWFITLSFPKNPVNAPAAPVESEPSGEWNYPSQDAMKTLTVDDFYLPLDGAVRVRCDVPASQNGLSAGFLEEKVTFDPPVEFTVGQEDEKCFLLYVEDGKNLRDARLKISYYNSDYDYETVVDSHFSARVSLGEGAAGIPIEGPIFVEFSDELDPASVAGQVQLRLPSGPDAEAEGKGRSVPCRVSAEGNLVKLAPEAMLDYNTNYSVTVPAGFASKNGLALSTARVMEVRTESRDFSLIMTNCGVNTFHPDDEVALEYQLDTVAKKGREATVTLCRLTGFDQYADILLGRDPESAPEAIGQARTEQMKEGLNTVAFPNPGRGYYAVVTTVIDTKTKEPVTDYKAFQVATASLYMQSAQKQMLLWLNDSATGGSLAGHTVRFTQDGKEVASAVTGEDGSAVFSFEPPAYEDPAAAESYYGKGMPPAKPVLFTIYDPSGVPVYADVTRGMTTEAYYYGGDFGRREDRYYAFFYLDRALYRPTDTVRFWGYLKPYRMNRGAMPSAVTVTLDPDGVNQQVRAAVQADGTFTGEFSFEQIVSQDYAVQAAIPCTPYTDPYSGEVVSTRVLDSIYIDVKEFTTPAYTIAGEVDGIIYRYGDEVTATITPTFYDGTPLPNYPLEFSLFNPYSGNFEAVRTVTTDAQGVARVTFKAGEGVTEGKSSWTPRAGYYYVKIANDGENVTFQGRYVYVPANVMLRPSLRFGADGNASLTVLANRIDLSRVTSREQADGLIGGYYDYNDNYDRKYDVLVGEPVDMQLSFDARYDYYDPKGEYQSGKVGGMVPLTAGRGTREALIEQEFDGNYYAYVSASVSYRANGSEIVAGAYADNGKPWPGDRDAEKEAIRGYTFDIYKNGARKPVQQYEQYLARSFVEADVGDTLRFELRHEGAPVGDANGRMLYTFLQDEIVGRGGVGDGFELTVGQQHANSILVVAAYFDGRDVHAVSNAYVRTKNESMALTVEASTDKEAYRPGEQVTVKAKVTDRAGRPVSGEMVVSVVDEAIFALREQYFDVLNELYGELDFYTYYVYKYTTSAGDIDPFNQSGDGGKGDGDNLAAYDSFRKNFKDTAAFYPLRSDANGDASVTFTLPDNVTSWRITTIAIGDNLYAGSSKTNFAATLPFFVKPVISPKYIAGDEVAVLVQGHGDALSEGGEISYQVRVTGDGVDRTFNETGRAYQPVQLNFGKLAEGEYTVTSTAQFGGMRDTVELPLAVIHSNLELVVNREIDLQKPIDIQAMRYPVTITMYDEEFEPYYLSVSSLLTHYCFRVDQRMSRYVAKQALSSHLEPEQLPQHIRADDGDVAGFQNADGGIGWYVNGPSDPEVTFKILLAAGDEYSKPRMRVYFAAAAEDSSADPVARAAAHAGLAVLDPSHTAKIREILAAGNVPFEEQLYYMAGLAAAGERQEARELYDGIVTPRQRTHGQEKWLEFSNLPKDYQRSAENRRCTTLAWITASELGLSDADAYAYYFARDRWRIGSVLECMIYVANFDRPVPAPAKFTCTAGGETRTVDLGATGRATITLNRGDMEGLAFHGVPDTVRATAYYIGEPSEVGIEQSDTVHVRKDFLPMEGGKYKVTLTVDFEDAASYGYWNVSDWVPSNMRLHTVARQPQSNQFWVNWTQENQKMYFEFYRDERSPSRVLIEYYIQKTYDAEAVVDRAYVICADSGENANTERSTLG